MTSLRKTKLNLLNFHLVLTQSLNLIKVENTTE